MMKGTKIYSTFSLRNILFVFAGILLLASACNKTNQYKWVYYNETYCSDAWSQSSNNEALKNNIIDYFKAKNVEIHDIEIFSDRDVESQSSCSNKTGRRIRCKVKPKHVDEMKSAGFYEE